ncbi:MAG TPA: flagellar biosynthesis protein FlhF [Pirellulales bacterium]|nr:flagellar biosynthesis protein FlhF [Pirellulales bacterium]
MEIRTYRASSMQEALRLVRSDLGPGAAVLHTREAPLGRLLRWLPGVRRIEVTASNDVVVPHRYPAPADTSDDAPAPHNHAEPNAAPTGDLARKINELQAMVEDLCRRSRGPSTPELPESLFGLYAELIDCEMPEDVARDLMERVRSEALPHELGDAAALRTRVVQIIEREIAVQPPIALAPGRCRVVALVGPTGVGKTTTIAKLAANFRLREKWNVGLITVDTYRIAAVEQLRTYADIIDLPMQVVSTPREMREAVDRMAHLDLVLLDTAGRSPRDEVKIRELRALLSEARADEVHLVLSSAASGANLINTADRFAAAGTTSLILTKLDEASGLGHLLPALRSARLPLSYLTNGQNVPDDIETAQPRRVAQVVLNVAARS